MKFRSMDHESERLRQIEEGQREFERIRETAENAQKIAAAARVGDRSLAEQERQSRGL